MPYYEFTISVADRFKDRLINKLMKSGCLGVMEGEDSFIAYFPGSSDVDALLRELSQVQALLEKSGEARRLVYSHRLIPEEDWNESWKKGFVPIDVGTRFTILPPWKEKRKDRINLIIDPAMAFGTGHHETTRSCLVLMEKYGLRNKKESFLDVGTGTGILAIAAAKLGYRRVLGVDTDDLAVDAARVNIELNQAEGIEIRQGGVESVKGAFDLIAANLISGVLVELASELAAHMKPDGVAILSGILTGQDDEVVDAMEKAGLKLVERYPDGKWTSLVVER